jgi:hypothetical protein
LATRIGVEKLLILLGRESEVAVNLTAFETEIELPPWYIIRRGSQQLGFQGPPIQSQTFCVNREFSVAVRESETVTLRHPVKPVADGFLGRFVWVDGFELRNRNGHLSPLPTDLHEHVVLTCILNRNA